MRRLQVSFHEFESLVMFSNLEMAIASFKRGMRKSCGVLCLKITLIDAGRIKLIFLLLSQVVVTNCELRLL